MTAPPSRVPVATYRMLWFFLKSDDHRRSLLFGHCDDAEALRRMYRHRSRRDSNVGVVLHVKFHHLIDVHAIDMVRSEHRDNIRLEIA